MNTKLPAWSLIPLLAVALGVCWFLTLPTYPPPPNFVDGGFTSVHVEFRRHSESPVLAATSNDPKLITELAEILRTGRGVIVCRCGSLGSVEFRRPDGTAEQIAIMPAHDDGCVEFRAGKGRFRVNREQFLRIVDPLRVPALRWYAVPDIAP